MVKELVVTDDGDLALNKESQEAYIQREITRNGMQVRQ